MQSITDTKAALNFDLVVTISGGKPETVHEKVEDGDGISGWDTSSGRCYGVSSYGQVQDFPQARVVALNGAAS